MFYKKLIIKTIALSFFLSIQLQQTLYANEKISPDVLTAISKCAECHGATGEKSALNRSIPINSLSEKVFIERLKGYLAGTYGGELKAFMRSRIAYLNKKQLKAIAKYYTSSQRKKEDK